MLKFVWSKLIFVITLTHRSCSESIYEQVKNNAPSHDGGRFVRYESAENWLLTSSSIFRPGTSAFNFPAFQGETISASLNHKYFHRQKFLASNFYKNCQNFLYAKASISDRGNGNERRRGRIVR